MGKRGRLLAAAVGFALTSSACSTVLFVRNPSRRVYTDAQYESSRPGFFFGLTGPENEVWVDKICLGKDIDQISTEYTPGDVLAGVITLGIYTPRTVKVWCQL